MELVKQVKALAKVLQIRVKARNQAILPTKDHKANQSVLKNHRFNKKSPKAFLKVSLKASLKASLKLKVPLKLKAAKKFVLCS